MYLKKIVFLSVFIISIIAVSFIAFAEEAPLTGADPVVITPNYQSAAAQEKGDTQWAWGEVINLDDQAKTFTIKYLDYEADSEKELLLAVDDKTTLENIKSLDELKLKDTLSVDYITGPDNKNIAKNISLEKSDTLAPVSAQTSESVPAAASVSATVSPEPNSAMPSEPAPAAESIPAPAPEAGGQAQ